MKKISIIIPMYNVGKYLEPCLESIYSQRFDESSFEIIMIDDESPDNSLEIAQNLSNKHSNIKIISQKNKGLGGARNTGIVQASGEYIWFHDPDDLIRANAFENIFEKLKKSTADIIEFGAEGIKGNQKIYEFIPRVINNKINGIAYAVDMDTMNSACNKLYSRTFMLQNQLFFLEHIYCEDIEFNSRCFQFADTVETISHVISSFVQTDNSITRNTSLKKQNKMIEDLNFLIERFNFFKSEVNHPTSIKYWEKRLTYLNVTLFYQYVKYKKGLSSMKKQKKTLKDKKNLFLDMSIKPITKNIFRLLIKYFI